MPTEPRQHDVPGKVVLTLVPHACGKEPVERDDLDKGLGQLTLRNSIGISNCHVFTTGSFPANPAGWNALTETNVAFATGQCRALDSMAFEMQNGNTVTIENVTNVGEQATSWDFANAGCTSVATCTMTFKNNTTMGFLTPLTGGYPGQINWGGPDLFSGGSSVANHNNWFQIGAGGTVCPGDPDETSPVCGDPKFASESNVNSMNVQLTGTSPLITAGTTPCPSTDFAGNAQTSPCTIGAYCLWLRLHSPKYSARPRPA